MKGNESYIVRRRYIARDYLKLISLQFFFIIYHLYLNVVQFYYLNKNNKNLMKMLFNF